MQKKYNIMQLQLTIIRIYIGLDFSPHFAEKLGLLGHAAYTNSANYFHYLGLSSAMLIFVGLIELAAALGFILGIMTRWAAVGTAVLLIMTTVLNKGYLNGFTWYMKGWEFPVFWAFIALTFVLTGGGKFSVDYLLRDRIPSKLKYLFK